MTSIQICLLSFFWISCFVGHVENEKEKIIIHISNKQNEEIEIYHTDTRIMQFQYRIKPKDGISIYVRPGIELQAQGIDTKRLLRFISLPI